MQSNSFLVAYRVTYGDSGASDRGQTGGTCLMGAHTQCTEGTGDCELGLADARPST